MPEEYKKKKLEIPIYTSFDGSRQGLWLGGWWVYWGKEYSLFKIRQERFELVVQWIIDAIIFVAGIAGLAWLLWLIFANYEEPGSLIRYILEPHLEMGLFWLSVLADMYVAYRLVMESRVSGRVLKPELVSDALLGSIDDIARLDRRSYINMFSALSPSAKKVVDRAWIIARRFDQPQVLPIHLLASSLIVGDADLVLARLAIPGRTFVSHVKKQLKRGKGGSPQFSPETVTVLLHAYYEAFIRRKPRVESTDIFVALSSSPGIVRELFREHDIDERKVRHVAEWLEFHKAFLRRVKSYKKAAQFRPKGEMNRSYTAVVTPFLNQFSTDMTAMARLGVYSPVVSRLNELNTIFNLVSSGKPGIMLVGERGVGRTAIIEGVAMRMVVEDIPEQLRDKRLVSVSTSAIVAGASQFGSAEKRLLGILREAQRSGNIVLFFDNIQELVGIGTEQSATFDLAQVLSDALENSGLIAFATTTSRDFFQHVEKSDLMRVFEKLDVEELDFDTSILVLESKAPYFEAKTRAFFSYPSLEELVSLSDRYMHEDRLPDKAILLMEELAQRVSGTRGKGTIVTKEDVQELIAEKTKIPIEQVTGDESKKLLALEDLMHERVVDQNQAVTAVATAVRRARTELREERRPIVNLLFLGPTGVGKTEVAKTLAEVYFGSEDIMIRFDMSEYQHKGSVYRLIGGAGNDVGLLTDAVRRRPFSLLLLDEVEKAHPNILNLFLQVMDDGRLTDSAGLTVDFTNTIIIATSNAGAFYIQDALKRGDSVEQIRSDLLESELRQFFRPEWLNRMDNIIVFKTLSMSDVVAIARLLLGRIIKKLESKEIGFVYDDNVIRILAEEGYSPEYGARPLRRVIQERIENPMSKIMLQYKVGRRDTIYLMKDFGWRVEKAKEL